MIVYRLCRKDEIESILKNKNFNSVGKFFKADTKKNNHKYLVGKKYLHFFKNKDSLLYLNLSPNRYICTYDIPSKQLQNNAGIGKYLDYRYFEELQEIEEFAIDTSLLKFEYLIEADKITDFIDYEDFFADTSLKDFMQTCYKSGQEAEREA